MSTLYNKHFFPLESNPDVFTKLIHSLGSPPSLVFEDVISLDEPNLLPHPALALILVLPTTERYERRKETEDALYETISQGDLEESVVWFKQTINNACGLYATIHALSNTRLQGANGIQEPKSVMATIFDTPPGERALLVENSSAVPGSAEDEVDLHYVCFVRSQKNGRLYELDGDRKGPLDRGVLLPEADLLGSGVPNVIRDCIRIEADNISFSLMALVRRD
ncbi:ubiquitin c-terminal hydrolase l3 [Purpureocillium lilacinum]|uniref:Ubiquitin carboxyl-terminal hydrolase n=1 Tax=Purpureocillium lilacinum TaxID=33203 RepID=A0A179EXD8_PURLI|nr:ubiquitin c-terminal hydrolase l3 [Purpureocillium lilacinum]OAQ57854.1 ubiquitin c-terminal hydrolase l3 [Purpureocillium lilacinum]